VNVDDFVSSMISKGKNPVLNGYEVMGKQSEARKASNLTVSTTEAYLKADGLAIFNKGKLVGWITHDKARGVVWVLGKVKGTDINLDWKGKKMP
jgi:spore germination protein KC